MVETGNKRIVGSKRPSSRLQRFHGGVDFLDRGIAQPKTLGHHRIRLGLDTHGNTVQFSVQSGNTKPTALALWS